MQTSRLVNLLAELFRPWPPLQIPEQMFSHPNSSSWRITVYFFLQCEMINNRFGPEFQIDSGVGLDQIPALDQMVPDSDEICMYEVPMRARMQRAAWLSRKELEQQPQTAQPTHTADIPPGVKAN